jgi:hypothetical protein
MSETVFKIVSVGVRDGPLRGEMGPKLATPWRKILILFMFRLLTLSLAGAV